MKKIIALALTAALTIPGATVLASTAYSIGTEYTDINTSNDAITAANNFKPIVTNSYYSTAPTYQYMRGNNPDTGRPRMESKVLFFSGHSNYDNIAFNYQGKGGDYATGVYWGANLNSTTGYKYAGISSYDMSYVDLVTYAGCLTAANNGDNIASRSVDRGAETAVGWTEKVAAGSHSNWLSRYTARLGAGDTVQEAVNYANSYVYLDSSVKKSVIYGNKSLSLRILIAGLSTQTQSVASEELQNSYKLQDSLAISQDKTANNVQILSDDKRKHTFNDSTVINLDNKDLEKYLHKIDSKININDYNIDLSNIKDGSGTIDVTYKLEDFDTTNGYTIVLEKNKVKSIYNNSVENQTKKPAKAVKQSDIAEAKKLALAQLPADCEATNQTGKKYFDAESSKYYYVVFTEYKHTPTGNFGKDQYLYEIK